MPRRLHLLALSALLLFPATAFADDPPQAGPVTAGSVTHDTAQVTARVNLDDDEAAYYWFEYGTTMAYGRASWLGYTTQDSDVSRVLTALAAGTSYHVRLVAWNDDEGYGRGPDRTFTTAATPASPPPPPGETPAPAPAEAPEADPEPAFGSTVAIAETRGAVRVRPPGSTAFVALDEPTSLPVGTVVNAARGKVELESALPDGSTQTGSFHGSRFQIRQSAEGDGRVNLHLRGGNLDGCGSRAVTTARASAAAKPKRRLWGSDSGGRFRTHGRDSVATVRGTRWNVTDSCKGTVTRVTEGAVDVRVRATGRVVRVDAGERHLARHHR